MKTQYELQEVRSLILSDMNFLKHKYNYNPLIGFLYGSQNYEIDTIYSDKDRKIIVVPSLDDLICNRQLNKEYIGEQGLFSTCDIRDFIKNLIKGSSYYWKFLIAEYYKTMNENTYFQQEIYPYAKCIIRINPIGSIESIYGQYHSYTKLIFFQNSEYYNKKAFVNAIRIYDLFDKYYEFIEDPGISLYDFKLLTPKNPKQLKLWKAYCPLDKQEVYELIKEYNCKIEEKYNKILKEWEDKTINKTMQKILEDFRYRIIKSYVDVEKQ